MLDSVQSIINSTHHNGASSPGMKWGGGPEGAGRVSGLPSPGPVTGRSPGLAAVFLSLHSVTRDANMSLEYRQSGYPDLVFNLGRGWCGMKYLG